jgi:hypothetical protein
MEAKQQAAELLMKYQNIESLKDYGGMDFEIAKQCALISVENILNMPELVEVDAYIENKITEYYNQVKSELNKL